MSDQQSNSVSTSHGTPANSRDSAIYMAKLSEQAERYEGTF